MGYEIHIHTDTSPSYTILDILLLHSISNIWKNLYSHLNMCSTLSTLDPTKEKWRIWRRYYPLWLDPIRFHLLAWPSITQILYVIVETIPVMLAAMIYSNIYLLILFGESASGNLVQQCFDSKFSSTAILQDITCTCICPSPNIY